MITKIDFKVDFKKSHFQNLHKMHANFLPDFVAFLYTTE